MLKPAKIPLSGLCPFLPKTTPSSFPSILPPSFFPIRPSHQRPHSTSSTTTATSKPKDTPRRTKRVVFSGIQPTGVPHIGNYIGALQNWKRLQDENELQPGSDHESQDRGPSDFFYAIVGLHAITIPREPERLKRERFEMMCTLLAIGLKPERCCLFNQDQVTAHSELAWILNCITPVGKLNRMTTWKSQLATSKNANSLAEVDDSMLHLGLLSYPVLQSADILLYKTTDVPVGEDQVQHLELTRMLAKVFNKQFKTDLFPVPKALFTPQSKILNLRNPSMKMSKSHPSPTTKILLTDAPDSISDKIQSSVTDSIAQVSYDPTTRPGVSNLLDIYQALTGLGMEEIEARFRGMLKSDLKREVAEVVVEHLKPIRNEIQRLFDHREEVEKVFDDGAERASDVAQETLRKVKALVGLL